MIKNLLLLVSLMLLSAEAFSEPYWFTSRIESVYPLANGDFVLIFSEDDPYCTASGDYHYVSLGVNGITAEGLKNIYSAALTAAAAGKKVTINADMIDGSSCYINRLLAYF